MRTLSAYVSVASLLAACAICVPGGLAQGSQPDKPMCDGMRANFRVDEAVTSPTQDRCESSLSLINTTNYTTGADMRTWSHSGLMSACWGSMLRVGDSLLTTDNRLFSNFGEEFVGNPSTANGGLLLDALNEPYFAEPPGDQWNETLGFKHNLNLAVAAIPGDFVSVAPTLEESSLALLPRSKGAGATGWRGLTRPTLHGKVDLVTGKPIHQYVDLELPVAGSTFRLTRSRSGLHHNQMSRFINKSMPAASDQWWDWTGTGWMIGENPILIIDNTLPELVANEDPPTTWLILDAHQSIPFQKLEGATTLPGEARYEAPPRFRARLTHNGSGATAPTSYTVSLYDGAVTYRFAAVRTDVPNVVPQTGAPDGPIQSSSLRFADVDENSIRRQHNMEYPEGVPTYGLCTSIEDIAGTRVLMDYCDGRYAYAMDDARTPSCVECAQNCLSRGQLAGIRVQRKENAAWVTKWTLLYVHRMFPGVYRSHDVVAGVQYVEPSEGNPFWQYMGFPLWPDVQGAPFWHHPNSQPNGFVMPQATSGAYDDLRYTIHGNIAIDRIYAVEGDAFGASKMPCLTIRHDDEYTFDQNPDPLDDALSNVHFAPSHAALQIVKNTWKHEVRYQYNLWARTAEEHPLESSHDDPRVRWDIHAIRLGVISNHNLAVDVVAPLPTLVMTTMTERRGTGADASFDSKRRLYVHEWGLHDLSSVIEGCFLPPIAGVVEEEDIPSIINQVIVRDYQSTSTIDAESDFTIGGTYVDNAVGRIASVRDLVLGRFVKSPPATGDYVEKSIPKWLIERALARATMHTQATLGDLTHLGIELWQIPQDSNPQAAWSGPEFASLVANPTGNEAHYLSAFGGDSPDHSPDQGVVIDNGPNSANFVSIKMPDGSRKHFRIVRWVYYANMRGQTNCEDVIAFGGGAQASSFVFDGIHEQFARPQASSFVNPYRFMAQPPMYKIGGVVVPTWSELPQGQTPCLCYPAAEDPTHDLTKPRYVVLIDEFDERDYRVRVTFPGNPDEELDDHSYRTSSFFNTNKAYLPDATREGLVSRRVVEINASGHVLRERNWKYENGTPIMSGFGLGESFIWSKVGDLQLGIPALGTEDPNATVEEKAERLARKNALNELVLVQKRSVGWSVHEFEASPVNRNTKGLVEVFDYALIGGASPSATELTNWPWSTRVQRVASRVQAGIVPNTGSYYKQEWAFDEANPGDVLAIVQHHEPVTQRLLSPQMSEVDATAQALAQQTVPASEHVASSITLMQRERTANAPYNDMPTYARPLAISTVISPPQVADESGTRLFPVQRSMFDMNGNVCIEYSGLVFDPLAPDSRDHNQQRLLATAHLFDPHRGFLYQSVVHPQRNELTNVVNPAYDISDSGSVWQQINLDSVGNSNTNIDSQDIITQYLQLDRAGVVSDVVTLAYDQSSNSSFKELRRTAVRSAVIRVATSTNPQPEEEQPKYLIEYTFTNLVLDPSSLAESPRYFSLLPMTRKIWEGSEAKGKPTETLTLRVDPTLPIDLARLSRYAAGVALDGSSGPPVPITKDGDIEALWNGEVIRGTRMTRDGNGRMANVELLEADANGNLVPTGFTYINELTDVRREQAMDGNVTRITRNLIGHRMRVYRGTQDERWLGDGLDMSPPAMLRPHNMVLTQRSEYGSGVNDAWMPTASYRYESHPAWADSDFYETNITSDELGYKTTTTYDWRMRPVRTDRFGKAIGGTTGERLETSLRYLSHSNQEVMSVTFGKGVLDLGGLDPSVLGPGSAVPTPESLMALSIKPTSLTWNRFDHAGNIVETRSYVAPEVATNPPVFTRQIAAFGHGGVQVYAAAPDGPTTRVKVDVFGREVARSEFDRSDPVRELTRTTSEYDALGNLWRSRSWDRVDTLNGTTPPAELEAGVNAVVSTSLSLYDSIDRVIASVELGTSQGLGNASAGYVTQVGVLSNAALAPGNIKTIVMTSVPGSDPTFECDNVEQLLVNASDAEKASAQITLFGYDTKGNRAYTRDPSGLITYTQYSAMGQPTSVIESTFATGAAKKITTNKYEFGRLQSTLTEHANSASEASSPKFHRVFFGAEIVDENFNVKSRDNSLVHAMWQGNQPPPNPTTPPTKDFTPSDILSLGTGYVYRYTFSRQLAERVDSRGLSMRYSYDGLQRLTKVVIGHYVGQQYTPEHYAVGYPEDLILGAQAWSVPTDRIDVVRFNYDDRGNLASAKAFRYNAQGAETFVNEVVRTFDSRDMMTAEYQQLLQPFTTANGLNSVSYTWDFSPADPSQPTSTGSLRLAGMKYPKAAGVHPHGKELHLAFGYGESTSNAAARSSIANISMRRASQPTSIASVIAQSLEYAGSGMRISTSLANGGAVWSLRDGVLPTSSAGLPSLDSLGRVRNSHTRTAAGGTLYREQTTFDQLGRRMSAVKTLADLETGSAMHNGHSRAFSYDDHGRLISDKLGEVTFNNTPGLPVITDPLRTDEVLLGSLGSWVNPANEEVGLPAPAAPINGPTAGRRVWGTGAPDGTDYTPLIAGNFVQSYQTWFGVSPQQATTRNFVQYDNGAAFWLLPSVECVHDAAGNLTFDGTFLYQYDAWNRLVQINQAVVNTQAPPINNGIPSDELLVPGPLVRSFVYDAFGRLVRTVSPWPEPGAAFTQYSTTRRYYYDGSRRIAEAWTDYIVTQSGGVTIASAIAAQAAQDAAAGQEQSSTSSLLEGEQIEFEEPVGGTTIVIKPITNLSRQYVWGPGDAGIDELVAQVDEVGRAMFAMQDAGGDVIAWFDRGSGPTGSTALLHSGAARTVAAATFDVYGQTLAWKAIDNLPPPSFSTSIGHKGLPYERFDVGLTTISGINGDLSPSGEVQYPTPQIASNTTGLYYVRNRWLSPSSGRWLTRDPNASGQSLLGLAWHAEALPVAAGLPVMADCVSNGSNLYEYVGGDGVNRNDPSGLFFSFIDIGLSAYYRASGLVGDAQMVLSARAATQRFMDDYSIGLLYDVEWALDWSASDDDNRRAFSSGDMTGGMRSVVGNGASDTIEGLMDPDIRDMFAGARTGEPSWQPWSPSRHGPDGAARPAHGASKHDRMSRAWATHFASKYGDDNVRFNQTVVDRSGKRVSNMRPDVMAYNPETKKWMVIEIAGSTTRSRAQLKARSEAIAKSLGVSPKDVEIQQYSANNPRHMPPSGGRRRRR